MTLEELEDLWNALESPSNPDGISGRRATGLPPIRSLYLAKDGRGRRHLLILVPDDTAPINQRETRGLEVSTARFQVGSNPEALYVDLGCIDSAQNSTFSAVVQDILRTVAISNDNLRDAIVNTLARWRAFWSTKVGGMSREDAIGLFGELWFMRRWLAPVNAKVIDQWQATQDARHDFQTPTVSIEVKTAVSRSRGEPSHFISSLDQMDSPENGQLFLFSLQVTEDALAANTVHSLVEGLTVELDNDFQALTRLNDKLAIRGYSPADRQAPSIRFRIVAERLYSVAEGFPRITRSTFQPMGLPSGISDVGYVLDLAACRPWLVATGPTDPSAVELNILR